MLVFDFEGAPNYLFCWYDAGLKPTPTSLVYKIIPHRPYMAFTTWKPSSEHGFSYTRDLRYRGTNYHVGSNTPPCTVTTWSAIDVTRVHGVLEPRLHGCRHAFKKRLRSPKEHTIMLSYCLTLAQIPHHTAVNQYRTLPDPLAA